jgi:hypothetical protein
MNTSILKLHSEGSQYVIIIRNKKYSKLLAIQDYPQRKYYFKNEEVSEEKLITMLDNIGSSEKMYIEEDKIMKFLDTEVELKLSDIKTIERIKWYFETYFEQFKKK